MNMQRQNIPVRECSSKRKWPKRYSSLMNPADAWWPGVGFLCPKQKHPICSPSHLNGTLICHWVLLSQQTSQPPQCLNVLKIVTELMSDDFVLCVKVCTIWSFYMCMQNPICDTCHNIVLGICNSWLPPWSDFLVDCIDVPSEFPPPSHMT